MECNKEEAIRAKDIAEKKMQNMDFAGAQKIALKAQQLYPSLENISQLLIVCEVHVAAELNMMGSEMDWYGILQVEQSADESSIKRQYRKLALQLHPDKNKFSGAESAFKLIGEAHRVLTDRTKRSVYDVKRRATKTNIPTKQAPPHQNKSSFTRKPPANDKNSSNHASSHFPGSNQPHQQQSQAPPTFWTACPFCGIKYQYYRTIMNRALRCQSCLKPFIAYDMEAQGQSGVNLGGAVNHSAVPQSGQTAGWQSRTAFQGNIGGGSETSMPFPATGSGVHADGGSQGKIPEDGNAAEGQTKPRSENPMEANKRAQRAQPLENLSRKKRRKVTVEYSDSCDSDSSDDDLMQDVGISSEHNPRRSSRHKQNVSYSENGGDHDKVEPPYSKSTSGRRNSGSVNGQSDETFSGDSKKAKGTLASKDVKETSMSTEGCLPNGKEQAAKPGGIDYPEPEFHDFDRDRGINCFKVDQIWATYDDSDGMPRFYARIRKVHAAELKLRITWLEAHPQDDAGCDWVGEELPYACGFFETGGTQDAALETFSHLVTWEKGPGKSSYKIYPKRGDIWALFKGWDIRWSADADLHRQHEYEVVEVLSDYSEQSGVEVMYLVKLRGFTSLFQRATPKGKNSFIIPPHELLRFSHRIPHHVMTGKERKDVPEGSVELDPASVPSGAEEVAPLKTTDPVKDLGTEGIFSSSIPAEKNEMHPTWHGNCNKAEETIPENDKNVHEKVDLNVRRRSPRKNNGCHEKKVNQTNANQNHHTGKTQKHLDTSIEDLNVTGEVADDSNHKKLKVDEKEKHLDTEKTSVDTKDCKKSQADEKEKYVDAGKTSVDTSDCRKLQADVEEQHLDDEEISDASEGGGSSPLGFECPSSIFFDFASDRSEEKFKAGQIWAVYSREDDGMPKYYVKITKIVPEDFEVHAMWLEDYATKADELLWTKKALPITCGCFKLGKATTFDSVNVFSHVVEAEYVSKSRRYDIQPSKGQIWALYKNWSIEWTCSSLKNCNYEIVEVLENSGSVFKVLVLDVVGSDLKTIFRRLNTTMLIQGNERLRFSHQIPAFMLTDEDGGKLRGCWELDPAAVPGSLLLASSPS